MPLTKPGLNRRSGSLRGAWGQSVVLSDSTSEREIRASGDRQTGNCGISECSDKESGNYFSEQTRQPPK